MESRDSQYDIDDTEIDKSLLTVMGIQDVEIIEQKNPNADQTPRIITMEIPSIGVTKIALPPLSNNHFFVRIKFTTPANLAMAQKELAKHRFFDKISISKKDPLVLGAKMTQACAKTLYDLTTYDEIDMALIEKYGGQETMKRFLHKLFLIENSITALAS